MTPTRMRAVAASAAAAAGLLLAAGCDGTARRPAGRPAADAEAAADAARPRPPADAKVPRPDPALIAFDPDSRTLTLYALPDPAAKWMLHVPEQPKGVPVNPVHQFMEEVDLDRVAVYYTTGTGQPSPRVTLRDVLAARDARAQR